MSLLTKLHKVKFAPTLNKYELIRRFIGMVPLKAKLREDIIRQMYVGIDKDACKAQKKGKLLQYISKLKGDKHFADLIRDVGVSMGEVDNIIKNATKEG